MTITVTITAEATDENPHLAHVIQISEAAIKRARVKFNPTGDPRILTAKFLAAAFYTEMDKIEDESGDNEMAYQEAFTAKQLMQMAALMAVNGIASLSD